MRRSTAALIMPLTSVLSLHLWNLASRVMESWRWLADA